MSQGWIISRQWDMLFFIGTPLLSLALLLTAARFFSSADIALFVLAFFAVGHHLPGFMRAYGERELFQRYKARFIVAPICITAFVGWSVFSGHLGFFIFLALWDMWHFFMQHYGFMRIYDVKRRKPRPFSARLDWWMTAIWFGYIVVASPHYLINFLERCHRYGFGLYTWIQPESIFTLRDILFYAAVGLSVVYVANMFWERRQGIPIVWPKLAISITTFATVFYAYIVLEDIILGYAVTALAHDVQYFAIVWIYNRGVLKRSRQLGASFFRFLFKDGRFRLVLFYVALILTYGGIEAFARATHNYLFYDIVKVVIAASAFMHYYYDGFMWKVRKKEIRQNLVDDDGSGAETVAVRWSLRPWIEGMQDWLERMRLRRAEFAYGFETGKQVLYFGIPIYFLAWSDATYSVDDVAAGQYLEQLAPEVAKTHHDLGMSYLHQAFADQTPGRQALLDQAIGAHRRAIELDPEFAMAYTHLGIAYSLKKEYRQAVYYHKKAIEIAPRLPQAHYNLGVEYERLGRLAQAQVAYGRAVEFDPQYARAYQSLALIHRRLGHEAEAKKYHARAQELAQTKQRRALSQSAMPWATGTPVKGS